MDEIPDKLQVTYKGEQRTLFMSFLRQNSCLRVIGNPTNLATLMIDPDMSENVLRIMVAPKGGMGEMFEVELGDEDLSAADVDAILLWVQRHLTAFFMKRFQQASEAAKELEPVMKDLASQPTGSAD